MYTKIIYFLGIALLGGAGYCGDGWTVREEVKERDAFASMNLCVTNGAPCTVRLGDPAGGGVEVVLGKGGTNVVFPPDKYRGQSGRLVTFPCPPLSSNTVFTLRRTSAAWGCYVDDKPVARMPELWAGPLRLEHRSGLTPPKNAADSYTQKLAPFVFEDNFLVPAGTAFPETWEKVSGEWGLHSVTGSISGASAGRRALSRQPLPAKSPNFYTMQGFGTNALLLAGEPFYGHYRYRASVQHNSGTNGIVFLSTERGNAYAFTAENAANQDGIQLSLWERPVGAAPKRLRAVQTELQPGQWLLLEVKLFDDRVICYADHIEVMRQKLPLPPGGRFGLFANTASGDETRFDDIAVVSHDDLVFDEPADAAFASHSAVPACAVETGKLRVNFPANVTNLWRFGGATSRPLRTEVRFAAQGDAFTVGLEADGGAYRFRCSQSGGFRDYVLERFAGGKQETLDVCRVAATGKAVTLALDALHPHELRGIADGRLVCLAMPAAQPGGIQGTIAVSSAPISMTPLSATSLDETLRDRFEKNPLYVTDPYMKHWSSPEGQWVTFTNGETWFKGDLTSGTEIKFPVVDGMKLDFAVPENATNGQCRVVVGGGNVCVFTPESGTNAAMRVAVNDIPLTEVNKAKFRRYTLGVAGLTVWLASDTALLAKTHLSRPLTGRRMQIRGMALDNLARTLVTRDNVFDTLFNESLYNWTINGGKWEVINRFYCEPTWSHMNGESATGLAALWSKYTFKGDFSIEFYAGLRMGWYTRAGDLNVSVMSKRNSPGDGYTAIATGWDPDHSQLDTRLLRAGKQLDVSQKYLVPRHRNGNVRRGYQPLVAGGRPIHGAWYAIQLRRTAGRLKYLYDNEPVFDVPDTQPLDDGSLGIWTYQNSMMVARIKIAAEGIAPRPFSFREIPVEEAGRPYVPPQVVDRGIRANGRPVQPLSSKYWDAYDLVSHPDLRFFDVGGTNMEMRVTSRLGGGTFLARSKLPPISAGKLMGWEFDIRQSPDACVNFLFSSERKNPKTGMPDFFVNWSYVISGSDEKRGPRRIAGKASGFVPTNGWQTVRVWLPTEISRTLDEVRVFGFGNLQPGEVQMGLRGNPPGAWYAVRNFREIHAGAPELTALPDLRAKLDAFAQTIKSMPAGQLRTVALPAELDPTRPSLSWVVQDLANFGLAIREDDVAPYAMLIRPTHPWPSPLLPPLNVTVAGTPAPFETDGDAVRVFIPYTVPYAQRLTATVTLADKRVFKQIVPMARAGTQNHPPVLLSFAMPEGGIETFENRPFNLTPYLLRKNTVEIDPLDPEVGAALRFRNVGAANWRLSGQLLKVFDPIKTPLLQFRYKGDRMANISFKFGGALGFSFAESYSCWLRNPGTPAKAVLDEKWHVWTAIPSDSGGEFPLSQRLNIPAAPIRFASYNSIDQTGLYSWFCIDNLAMGPAVGPNRPFAFKADYADPDGVAKVQYAVLTGPEPLEIRDEKAKGTVVWTDCGNEVVVQPDIAKLKDGVHHLVVRAADKKGAWSVPADVPFLLDRVPPKITAATEAAVGYNGSVLRVKVVDPVAPPVPDMVSLKCLGREIPLKLDRGKAAFAKGVLNYEIDWIWSLQKELRAAKDGDILPVEISGVADASGNTADPFIYNIKVDFENDKRPPTILPTTMPTNALVLHPHLDKSIPFFDKTAHVTFATASTPDGEVLAVTPVAKGGFLQKQFTQPWNPDAHPWLALSFRKLSVTNQFLPFTVAFTVTNPKNPNAAAKTHVLQLLNKTNGFQYVSGKVERNNDEWSDILIDVRRFVREQTPNCMVTPKVTFLTLHVRPQITGGKFQLRALAILGDWQPTDLFKMEAYDLSGIKGLVWKGGGSPNLAIKPRRVGYRAETPCWFKFRVSDNRGNLSPSWMLPIVPPPAATKAKKPPNLERKQP
ncbi:MAG: hypothetical protein J6Z49_06510 [Kiritimatiellae bacterium]|nr:hypothetical protein [Kiritimatiellia bacterium]